MKKTLGISILSFLLIAVLLLSSVSHAQFESANPQAGRWGITNKAFQANESTVPSNLSQMIRSVVPGGEMGFQRSTLEALVGSTVEPLNWPQLPRVWWRFDTYESQTTTNFIDLKLSEYHASGNARLAQSLKYTRTVSLVLVGSLRSVAENEQNMERIDVGILGQVHAPELIVEDSTSGRLFPNVRKEYPMVGLCVYDVSMAKEVTSTIGADFWGVGQSHERTKGFGTPFSLYSNFFQLDSDKPILGYYIQQHCQKIFETAVQKWVEKQFVSAYRAYITETQSECLRDRGGQDRRLEGDLSCQTWHQQYPAAIQNSTVARCERGRDELFHCQLRAKQINAICPFRQNQDGKFVPSPFAGPLSLHSYPCDTTAGLTCIQSQPADWIESFERQRILLPTGKTESMGRCQKTSPGGTTLSTKPRSAL